MKQKNITEPNPNEINHKSPKYQTIIIIVIITMYGLDLGKIYMDRSSVQITVSVSLRDCDDTVSSFRELHPSNHSTL